MINWFDRYIIVGEKTNSSIIVIDLIQRRVITVIKNNNGNSVISLKQINHPLFGQSLLVSDLGLKISLWTH